VWRSGPKIRVGQRRLPVRFSHACRGHWLAWSPPVLRDRDARYRGPCLAAKCVRCRCAPLRWIKTGCEHMTLFQTSRPGWPLARPCCGAGLQRGWGWFTHCRVSVPQRVAPRRARGDISARSGSGLTCTPCAIARSFRWTASISWVFWNTTPDSFFLDGGQHCCVLPDARRAGRRWWALWGRITAPVPIFWCRSPEGDSAHQRRYRRFRGAGLHTPISIDTRKSAVPKLALAPVPILVNDVSGLPLHPACAFLPDARAAVCVMHARRPSDRLHLDQRQL